MSSWRLRSLLVAPILLGGSPGPVLPQSLADRAQLDAFRDSLAGVTTAAEVQALSASRGGGSTGLIRAGLAAFRRGEMGDDRGPYDEGIQLVERAIDGSSKAPYPWYALGLIQLGMYRRAFLSKPSNYTPTGASYREAALRSFGKAIENDSTFLPAADALAAVVVSLGHRLLPKALADPLRRVELVPGTSPEVNLAVSRVAFSGREYERALQALGDYLRRGGDRGLASVEQARTLTALGRQDEAVATYLAGVRSLDPAGRLSYREDLAWIAGEDELRAYDTLPAAGLSDWITRFWQERDALSLRSPNERLAEHLRRWVYAHENFLLHRPDDVPANAEGFGPQDQASLYEVGAVAEVMTEVAGGIPAFRAYRRTQWELDDRGVMYIRHGVPTKMVSSVAGPPNESWAYDLPEGRRVFHFIGSRALGTQAATTLTASLPLNPDMLDARADLDSRYAVLASKIQLLNAQANSQGQLNKMALHEQSLAASEPGLNQASAAATAQMTAQAIQNQTAIRLGADELWREVARNRTAIAAAVSSDGYPRHFRSSLDAIVQVYGLGLAEGESRRILIVFAVPGALLAPRARPDGGPGILYPLGFRLIALDRSSGVVRQLDTTRVFLVRDTLRGDQHLTGLLELPVPPGVYQVRTLLSESGAEAATGVGRDSVAIPSSPQALSLSDLILGRNDSGLTWAFEGEQVPLNPLNAYPRGADAALFYEVAGLTPGRTYRTTIAVRKGDDKPTAKPQVQVSFDFTASGASERVRRSLGLGNLKPDTYILQVRVQEVGSERGARRDRALNILPR